MSVKEWYLAAGKKKVGPLSASRVAKRIAAGKVPSGTMAWKEGMSSWMPVAEIPDFSEADVSAASDSDMRASAEGGVATKTARKKKKKRSRSKVVAVDVDVVGEPVQEYEPTIAGQAFQQRYRIERKDVYRGFSLGLERGRMMLVLASVGMTVGAVGLSLAFGALLMKLHIVLALPAILVAVVAGLVLGSVSLGALSYYSRCQLEEREPPTVKEALSFAFARTKSLALTPLALSLAWAAPFAALLAVSLLVKIPYLGPVATGLLYGIHIALSALTLFLILTFAIGSIFGPIVIAFEDTDVGGTLKSLMELVKASSARLVLWSILPGMAFSPFSFVVLGIAALILALPIGLTVAMVGSSGLGSLSTAHMIGAIPMALWVGLFVGAAMAILVSVNNSLMSLLYLGGRDGNDDLITRDAYLAQRSSQRKEG